MVGRIVEIAQDGRHLSLHRGFLVVSAHGENRAKRARLGLVPLDDTGAIVANGHGLTYSNNLVLALADHGIPFVRCGSQSPPRRDALAVVSHHRQAAVVTLQTDASAPLRKRLWQHIVQAKIRQQAGILNTVNNGSR